FSSFIRLMDSNLRIRDLFLITWICLSFEVGCTPCLLYNCHVFHVFLKRFFNNLVANKRNRVKNAIRVGMSFSISVVRRCSTNT
ncbi:MAG: hypothetical protein V3S97_08935, partial [Candidatus Bathyarchaeia archaeon]